MAGWLLAVGCGEAGYDEDEIARQEAAAEEIAASYCQAKADCECDGVELESCQAELAEQFAAVSESARAIGLRFAPECADEIIETNASFGCGTKAELSDLECRICKLYFGDQERGEVCREDENLLFDDCVQGLSCIGGLCDDPCEEVPEGGSCLGKPCAEGLVCELGFDAAGDVVAECVRLPELGEPCGEPTTCQAGLTCDETSMPPTCASPPAVGEPCTDVCAATAWCDGETCQALRADGEACELGASCRSGHCSDGLCGPPPPYVCEN